MEYSIAQRVKIVKTYYKNNNSVSATFRALNNTFGRPGHPVLSTIWSVVAKFEQTGSVANIVRPVHHRNARSVENIDAVRKSLDEDPNLSISRRALQLGLSYGTVYRILHTDLRLPQHSAIKSGCPKIEVSGKAEEHSADALDESNNEDDKGEELHSVDRSPTDDANLNIGRTGRDEECPKKDVADKRAANNASENEDCTPKKRGRSTTSAKVTTKATSGKTRRRPKAVQSVPDSDEDENEGDPFQNNESNEELELEDLKSFSESNFYIY